ncbi:hypothetical protein K439DRAFT_310838 [Ramaria rubella]|nr:hypothetical protein K439DRAFT_310838 [Ramaria rubella]
MKGGRRVRDEGRKRVGRGETRREGGRVESRARKEEEEEKKETSGWPVVVLPIPTPRTRNLTRSLRRRKSQRQRMMIRQIPRQLLINIPEPRQLRLRARQPRLNIVLRRLEVPDVRHGAVEEGDFAAFLIGDGEGVFELGVPVAQLVAAALF